MSYMRLFDCTYSPQFDIFPAKNPDKDYYTFEGIYCRGCQSIDHWIVFVPNFDLFAEGIKHIL